MTDPQQPSSPRDDLEKPPNGSSAMLSRYVDEGYSTPTTYTAGSLEKVDIADSGEATSAPWASSPVSSTMIESAAGTSMGEYSSPSVHASAAALSSPAPNVSPGSANSSRSSVAAYPRPSASRPETARPNTEPDDDEDLPYVANEAAPSRPKGARIPRRAQLQLRHIEPMSMLRFSFVLSCAMFVVWMVAVGLLYGILAGIGVFGQINDLFGELTDGGDVITPGLVFGGALIVGLLNIVLFTALATVGSFIYNLCADMVGGVEVTFAERE